MEAMAAASQRESERDSNEEEERRAEQIRERKRKNGRSGKGKENQAGGGRDGEADRAGKAGEKRGAARTGGRERRIELAAEGEERQAEQREVTRKQGLTDGKRRVLGQQMTRQKEEVRRDLVEEDQMGGEKPVLVIGSPMCRTSCGAVHVDDAGCKQRERGQVRESRATR